MKIPHRDSMTRRRLILGGIGLVSAAAGGLHGVSAADASADTDVQRIDDLVSANRICADQGLLEGFGHVSVRSASRPDHYFMAQARAPGLVTQNDILEFNKDSTPLDTHGWEIYSERYIHGEIYRVRPDVQAVVHSHSSAVIPFSITSTPLLPVIHVAYFLGTEPVPVFDLREAAGEDNKMLVNTSAFGAALARKLGDRAVVLMRGHGMAVAGPSLQWLVFRAIYTQLNAQILTEALALGQPVYLNRFEVDRTDRVDRLWELWKMQADAHSIAR